ncbi:hypothetical protein J6590_048542 [Homalodisca vitripennis]|nr:hypothetical protein J6590_048542 [Homalodisca vitripennis]
MVLRYRVYCLFDCRRSVCWTPGPNASSVLAFYDIDRGQSLNKGRVCTLCTVVIVLWPVGDRPLSRVVTRELFELVIDTCCAGCINTLSERIEGGERFILLQFQ